MRSWRFFAGALCGVLAVLVLAGGAQAVRIDKAGTLEFRAKLQTRVTIKLQDSDGWTLADTTVGNLVQWRNLANLEIEHDLRKLTNDLDLLAPFKWAGIDVKYRLSGRFMYEAVYDVGPQAFQDVKDNDKENVTNFSQQFDLWEFYFDFVKGPAFVRLGWQSLAWGETDIFRLMDGINPLDNTFGGPFEDLDDRRIPLLMLRGSYSLGNLGPLTNINLEGFWVPGFWESRVAPWAPFGSPYSAPLPVTFEPFVRIDRPERDISNSRWGVRVNGIVGPFNVSLGHYQTFLDAPTLTSVVDQSKLTQIGDLSLLTDLGALTLRGSYPDVQITGLSTNFWQPQLDTVFRTEVAMFWDEPVFIPKQNLASLLDVDTIPLPPALLDLAAEIFGVDLRDLGLDGIPVNPRNGTIPKKNILRFMIGLDKSLWIRKLNKTSTFFVSLQYFGQYVLDHDKEMAQQAPIYPHLIVFPRLKEYESVFTTIIQTFYMNGFLIPQLAVAYDPRGAWLVLPSATYIHEPFRFTLQYSAIAGNYTNFGLFRDRDQISFVLSYLL